MSETYIPDELRRLVISRAARRCEYCGIAETDTWLGCEVDHIISEKHGGSTDEANLAFACVVCNRAKGSDIATLAKDGAVVELFHPHRHIWNNHFSIEGARIVGSTRIGRATERLLKLNAPDRIEERVWIQRWKS